MARMYKIDNGDTFEGTLDQFCDCFFSNADEETISAWCADNGFNFEAYDTVDPATEDENPHGLMVAGYSNVTALHPRGSYIGWSRGPTVFAGPLAYMSEVNDRLDRAAEREADLEDESVRKLFLRLLEEAKSYTPYGSAIADNDPMLLVGCSIPVRWFAPGDGRFTKFTPDVVKEMSTDEVCKELVNLIAQCFKQR